MSTLIKQQLQLDATRSRIGFTVRSTATPPSARGRFRRATGRLTLQGRDPVAADCTIEVASLDTGLALRDRHLLSPDFLDARRHPTITFRSDAVTALGDGAYELRGALTIHGVTRELAVGTRLENHLEGVIVRSELTIDRRDFGVQRNRFDVAMVGAAVAIDLELHAA